MMGALGAKMAIFRTGSGSGVGDDTELHCFTEKVFPNCFCPVKEIFQSDLCRNQEHPFLGRRACAFKGLKADFIQA
jgi:hypothetical protein